jgi:hypothetical protein
VDELLALFRFLVPYFATTPDADVLRALTIAAPYRPSCLSTTQQDEAQVYYAAWILYGRSLQTQASSGPAIPVGVTSEKEGDLQRTYGQVEGSDDPFGYWKQYSDLAARCVGGAITVGTRGAGCCPPAYISPRGC